MVCSNSFRSDDAQGAPSGYCMPRCAGSARWCTPTPPPVPAGAALAVNRDGFAAAITAALEAEPLIDIRREEVFAPPPEWDSVIIASGPLPGAGRNDARITGEDALAFFDAIAPDRRRPFNQLRKNLPFVALRQGPGRPALAPTTSTAGSTRAQYEAFVDALLAGEKIAFRDFDGDAVGRLLPIEVMAERGRNAAPSADGAWPRRSHTGRRTSWCSCGRTTSSARCWIW